MQAAITQLIVFDALRVAMHVGVDQLVWYRFCSALLYNFGCFAGCCIQLAGQNILDINVEL